MRYMTTAKLQKDMVLGQDIYDGCGNLLFPKGMALIYENIQKLQSLGCPGRNLRLRWSSSCWPTWD